jgi:predicted HTH domain antitoxin
MKTLQIELTESVIDAIRLPESEQPDRLRLELALALYAQDLISLGKAAELAGSDRHHFSAELARRHVSRHYGREELEEDLVYARRQ